MFLDTSGLFCLHNADDMRHRDAVSFYRTLPRWLTSSYVLTNALTTDKHFAQEGFVRLLLS